MNENIYFIEDTKFSGFAKKLSVKPLEFDIDNFQDYNIHKWLLSNIKHLTVETIIIPCSLGDSHIDYWGIRVALHLRLTESLGNNRFCKILFISGDSLEQILILSDLSFIFSTAGILLSDIDNKKIEENINKLESINFNKDVYESKFLNKIFIEKPPDFGNHEIGNLWGAKRLSDLCGLDMNEDNQSEELNGKINSLFFKYRFAISKGIKNNSKYNLKASQNEFKTLLIDDKAEEGWSNVIDGLLKKINEKNELKTLSNFDNNYIDSIVNEISNNSYDLILLDLRLFEKDEFINETSNMSGSKVLREIKKKDNFPYMPVIIFTASNKAWNLKKLFNYGADGYYIKESYEYGNDINFSEENIEQFNASLNYLPEKGWLLKNYWLKSAEIKNDINNKVKKNIKQRISDKLDLAFGIITMRQNSFLKELFIYTDFELAFLIYWSILNEVKIDLFKKGEGGELFLKGDVNPIYIRKPHPKEKAHGKFETINKDKYEIYKETEG